MTRSRRNEPALKILVFKCHFPAFDLALVVEFKSQLVVACKCFEHRWSFVIRAVRRFIG